MLPTWLTGYRRAWLRPDLLAGVTVTAYLVPQVIAYAGIAGLSPTTGLWATVGALAAYAWFGSSRQLSVGPESTTALMTASVLVAVDDGDRAEVAVALAIAVGVVCLLAWVARLSVLAELFSKPVLVGYMAGVAVLMVRSQWDELSANLLTAAVAATTLLLMLAVGWRWRLAPVALLGIVGASLAAALAGLPDRGLALVDPVSGGLPELGLPSLDTGQMLGLLVPALGVAFVGYTDNVLSARAFAERHGERIDARRELLALGAANFGAAALHGFPVSSSGSRTAIIDAAGGRSQLVGVVSMAATVAVTVSFAAAVGHIPVAALGAVVVYAALRLVDVAEFRRLARFRLTELALALATTAAVLVLDVLYGVLVAVALSLLDLLHRVARPSDAVQGFVDGVAGMHDITDFPEATTLPGLVVYRYDSPLFFANAEDFRQRALDAVHTAEQPVRWLLLNTEAWTTVDLTACDALESLRSQLAEQGTVLALARVKQDLRDALAPTGLLERVGDEHVFPTLPTAVAAYREATGG